MKESIFDTPAGKETPSARFLDGMLWFRSCQKLYVVSAWPNLQAWHRPPGEDSWQVCDKPDLDLQWARVATESIDLETLPFADYHRGQINAYKEYLDRMPHEVMFSASSYPEGHWRLLQAFRRLGPAASDLASGNSFALLFMLAHLDRFGLTRAHDWQQARLLVTRRQRDTLGRMGFSPKEWAARFLRKIPAASCSVRNLRRLRLLLRNPELRKRLAHLPRINTAVITMVGRPEVLRVCSQRLLVEVGLATFNDDIGISAWELNRGLHLLDLLGECPPRQPFQEMAQIDAFHNGLQARVQQVPEKLYRFQAPPLPRVSGLIEPVADSEELRREGAEMSHCVASYIDEIAAGNTYVYRILGDGLRKVDRATLMIARSSSGAPWAISELKGRHNLAVSTATKALARRFVLAAQADLLSPEDLRRKCLAAAEKVAN
jgi:hypothetical protein